MKKIPKKQWRTNKDNTKYICDGDCNSWGLGICTCGLYRHLIGISKISLFFSNKIARHQSDILRYLLENQPVERIELCPHSIDFDLDCNECNLEHQILIDQLLKDLSKPDKQDS